MSTSLILIPINWTCIKENQSKQQTPAPHIIEFTTQLNTTTNTLGFLLCASSFLYLWKKMFESVLAKSRHKERNILCDIKIYVLLSYVISRCCCTFTTCSKKFIVKIDFIYEKGFLIVAIELTDRFLLQAT